MKLFFATFFFLLSYQASADDLFSWSLQVTDHNFELSHYPLKNAIFKPYLKKTSWRCRVGKEFTRTHLRTRELFCDYSIKKTGAISTKLSCSSNVPYNDITLNLYDQAKRLELTIMLSCKKK